MNSPGPIRDESVIFMSKSLKPMEAMCVWWKKNEGDLVEFVAARKRFVENLISLRASKRSIRPRRIRFANIKGNFFSNFQCFCAQIYAQKYTSSGMVRGAGRAWVCKMS
jgi:hypothetical protein